MPRPRVFLPFIALLLLALLPIAVFAQGREQDIIPSAVQSSLVLADYPPPTIPERASVDDGYFSNAILVGDSLASGVPYYKVMPALEVLYHIGLAPRSIAADNVTFKLNGRSLTLPQYLAARNPDIVYIWLGLNGVDGSPAHMVLDNYDIMLDKLIGALPDTLFCLIELPPVALNATDRHHTLTNKNVNLFNIGLMQLAWKHNIYLLQIHDLLLKDDILPKKYAAADGYHLKKTAYEGIVNYLYTHTLPLRQGAQENNPPHRETQDDNLIYIPYETAAALAPVSTPAPTAAAPEIRAIAALTNPNGGVVVNFRAQPSFESEILSVYPVGKTVAVLDWLDDDWALVSIDGVIGYVSRYFLKVSTQ
ncbi:MAG: GDSL-type esterase/lipase family protein [Oscillospiraceae bacterium]|nr:GDSL-type esterase/lipase family protein [Oscillospiraceae bacterium]